MGEFHHQGR